MIVEQVDETYFEVPHPATNMTTAPTYPTVDEAIEARFRELSELEEGWDHESARPIDPHAVAVARQLVARSSWLPQAQVFPLPTGGIQVEWTAGGLELEIEIEPGARSAVFLSDDRRSGERLDGELPGDEGLLRHAISHLFTDALREEARP